MGRIKTMGLLKIRLCCSYKQYIENSMKNRKNSNNHRNSQNTKTRTSQT